MSNEISENCCLCNKPNDQMLMLSCVHDPCINCAASAFAEQIHIKGRSKEVKSHELRSMSVKFVGKRQFSIARPSLNLQHSLKISLKHLLKPKIFIKIQGLVLLKSAKKLNSQVAPLADQVLHLKR